MFLPSGATSLGVGFGFAGAVAIAFDGDHVSVMDDAVDERGGAGGAGKDAGPTKPTSAMQSSCG